MTSEREGPHHARLELSGRLQRVLFVLQGGGAYTTREVQDGAQVAAAGEACTQVRKNLERNNLPRQYQGYKLGPSRRITTRDGTQVSIYYLQRVVPTGGGGPSSATTRPSSPPLFDKKGQLKLL